MILVIDSGNSRIKLGLLPEIAHPNAPALVTVALERGDAPGVAAWLAQQGAPITQAWGVNVAGQAQQEMLDRILAENGCTIRWQRAQVRTGWLRNGYQSSGQLGPDRWASMVGVASRSEQPGQPFVLACFGTATTIDIVDGEGLFQGGMILPGPALMRRSLATGTADLPMAQSASVLFPTDTHAAIMTGIAAAQAGAFARQCRLATQQFGQVPALYAAGGGWFDVENEARRLLADLVPAARHNPSSPDRHGVVEFLHHPVLDGLIYMARMAHTEERHL